MKSFEFVIAFYETKQTLYAIRPIAVKLQRSDLDYYEGYNMVDSIIREIKDLRYSLDTKFSQWFAESSNLTEAVGGSVARPRTAQRQIHRSNAPAQTTEEYFRINLAASLVDHLLSEMDTCFNHESRTAATLFEVIPKLILENHDLENLAEKLLYWENDLPSPLSLTDELNHWKNRFSIVDQLPTNPVECIRLCDLDIYPNIYELLAIGCVSPVGISTAERSFSALRRVKKYLRNRMSVERLTGLCLMHIHHNVEVDVITIIGMFINENSKRLFTKYILMD
ncbi:52 kDa repressor of the inhibitor of the protein kinase-like [Palaemon carinicauda]|uniref:52 kDa repressor of the inhibitor of the protein kinase-like n=1 Tax=Palaemon carinicauda TaxID=392227 RepID=UPI0035B5DCF6